MFVPEIGLDTSLSRSQVDRLFEPLLKRLLEVRSTLLPHCTIGFGLLITLFFYSAFEAGSYNGFYQLTGRDRAGRRIT